MRCVLKAPLRGNGLVFAFDQGCFYFLLVSAFFKEKIPESSHKLEKNEHVF